MTSEAERVEEVAKKLTKAQREALIAAKPHDDGEIYAAAYSLPDRYTGSYRVYGRGDPLNRVGLAVRAHLLAKEGRDHG